MLYIIVLPKYVAWVRYGVWIAVNGVVITGSRMCIYWFINIIIYFYEI